MTLNRTRWAAIAGIGVTAVLAPILVTKSRAQDAFPPAQPPGGFQGTPMPGGAFQPMMQMGPATMVADSEYLYILQGNRILKVKKADLSIAATKPLPGGPGGMMPPGATRGGFGPPRAGAGFGTGGGNLK